MLARTQSGSVLLAADPPKRATGATAAPAPVSASGRAEDVRVSMALPDQRQLAHLCAVLVRNLALAEYDSAQDAAPPADAANPTTRAAALTRARRAQDARRTITSWDSDAQNDRTARTHLRPTNALRRAASAGGEPAHPNGLHSAPWTRPRSATVTAARPAVTPVPEAEERSPASSDADDADDETAADEHHEEAGANALRRPAPGQSRRKRSESRASSNGSAATVRPSHAAPSLAPIPVRARPRSRSRSSSPSASTSSPPTVLPRNGSAPVLPSASTSAGAAATAASRSKSAHLAREREQRRRDEALRTRLVDTFVSLELLPPDPEPTDEPVEGEAPGLHASNRAHRHGRARSGSVVSLDPTRAKGKAPGMVRSDSAGSGSVSSRKTPADSTFPVPSPRKQFRRRTISSALFAPLPPLPHLSSDPPTGSPKQESRQDGEERTTVESTGAGGPEPFFVSDVVPATTQATFFLDAEHVLLPALPGAPSKSATPAAPPRPRVAAFPEGVRDWPGWAEGRLRAKVFGRRAGFGKEAGLEGRKEEEGDGWSVLFEWDVDLSGLTSLGRDPAAFPQLPPNTLVFALSASGGPVPSFPGDSAASPSDLEYFSAPIPLLQKAHRRRLRAARRRREAQAARDRGLLQPRSWSEDELERDAATGGHGYGYGYGYGYDYGFGWCDDSDCSSCDGAGGPADDESDGGIAGNWADLDAGGHASDPGTGAGVEGRARRARSDTIRSRRAGRAAAAGRRGTLVSGGAHEPLGGQAGGQQQRRRRHPTLSAAEEEQRVLETSRRETRMVRAAEWDEVRKLWEARWGVERVKDEIAGERAAVERVLGSEEDGWAAQERWHSELQDRLEDLEAVKEAVEAEVSEEQHEIEIRGALLRQRRERLERAKQLEKEQLGQFDREATRLDEMERQQLDLAQSARVRRTQLITLLSHIFPIEPVTSPPKGLSPDVLFSILGIPLPNSTFPSSYSDDNVSTALGYAAQVTQLVAAYLAVPLCYPITCRGSRSYVRDEISMMKGPRAFPLFGRGVDRYRFDYGVFLLNKNIERLMYAQGLTVLDLRNTLPNLKTLILSLSYDPSHDDYLASTLLPTGPFAALTCGPDDAGATTDGPNPEDSGDHLIAAVEEADRAASVRTTRSSRSGSNASTIRPGQRATSDGHSEPSASRDSGDGAQGSGEDAATDARLSALTAGSGADSTSVSHAARSKRRGRRRASSNSSEKVTLVTSVQKPPGQVDAQGTAASGSATTAGSTGGGGYGAKLREGLWSVVAGNAGRRDPSTAGRQAPSAAADGTSVAAQPLTGVDGGAE